jgi:hypothetical protein
MKQSQLSLVERSLRAFRLAAVAIVAAGAAAYSPFFSGFVGAGTPTGDAIGAAASWVVANLASLWEGSVNVLPAAGAAFGPRAASAAPSGTGAPGAPMVLTPPPKPASSSPTPAAAASKPPTTTAAPSATRPAASAPATTGAIPSGSASAASQAPAPPPNLSSTELAVVLTLVRNTLVALNQANLTGNYTVLRDLGAPGFREANNSSRLAEIFAPVRALNIDLSPVVLIEPRLTVAKVNDNGMLSIAGSLPTQPVVVSFEMLYQRVQNGWQIFGVSISTDAGLAAAAPKPSGGPAAGPTPAAAPAASPPTTRGTTPRP